MELKFLREKGLTGPAVRTPRDPPGNPATHL